MKARVHKGDDVNEKQVYDNTRKSWPVQETQVHEFHCLAGVEESPCVWAKWNSFKEY